MKILASSDLHYNIKRSIEPTRELAREVCRRGGDVFILAGDIAGSDETIFTEALELFSGFKGEKLLVAGNHDLWVRGEVDSFEKWSNRLPALASAAGFHMLDHSPRIVGEVGIAGNIGWYDYSFRDSRLAVPLRFYQAKIGPGRAQRLEEWQHLVAPADELLPIHSDITSAWRDGEFVRLNMSDESFVETLLEKLKADLEGLEKKCKKIVTVLHHLPRQDLVWYRGDPNWDFAAAFLGSGRFDEVLKGFPQIQYCLAGHNHRSEVVKTPETEYIAIGSTYLEKNLLELEI
jgi:predicted phosphohydrolase